MFGLVTRDPKDLGGATFDRYCYEVKDVTGRRAEPTSQAVNMVSCFGDTAAAERDPSIVPVSEDGEPATRDSPYFDWAYVCPSRESYWKELLDLIETCTEVNPDVRLDDVGFPRAEYCYCETCERLYTASDIDNRFAWRAEVITDFVSEAAALVQGVTSLTLYPDPYPGHLYERAGIDLPALSELVDEFVVPLYDMAYSTTYWLEVIASAFADRLEIPFVVELYAVDIDVEALVHATEVAESYSEGVYFAYDTTNALAALDRLR